MQPPAPPPKKQRGIHIKDHARKAHTLAASHGGVDTARPLVEVRCLPPFLTERKRCRTDASPAHALAWPKREPMSVPCMASCHPQASWGQARAVKAEVGARAAPRVDLAKMFVFQCRRNEAVGGTRRRIPLCSSEQRRPLPTWALVREAQAAGRQRPREIQGAWLPTPLVSKIRGEDQSKPG